MESSQLEIVQKIKDLFVSKKLTLAVAESCTGGLVGHLITSVPGASKFFQAGVISYSAGSKTRLLGVKDSVIEEHGTISEETARAMAHGAEEATGADVALAITGNLGPDPIEDKKTGLVYIAVSSGKGATSRGFLFEGSRLKIKQSASETALHFLYDAVSAWT